MNFCDTQKEFKKFLIGDKEGSMPICKNCGRKHSVFTHHVGWGFTGLCDKCVSKMRQSNMKEDTKVRKKASNMVHLLSHKHFEIFRAEGEEKLIRKLKEEGWSDEDVKNNLEDGEIRARLEGRPSPKLIAEIKFVVAAAVLPFPFVLPFMIGIWTVGGFEKLSAPLGPILMFLGVLLGVCWIFVGFPIFWSWLESILISFLIRYKKWEEGEWGDVLAIIGLVAFLICGLYLAFYGDENRIFGFICVPIAIVVLFFFIREVKKKR